MNKISTLILIICMICLMIISLQKSEYVTEIIDTKKKIPNVDIYRVRESINIMINSIYYKNYDALKPLCSHKIIKYIKDKKIDTPMWNIIDMSVLKNTSSFFIVELIVSPIFNLYHHNNWHITFSHKYQIKSMKLQENIVCKNQ